MIYPDKYRGVSVTKLATELTEESLRAAFVGRQVYFKTRWAVVTGSNGTAIIAFAPDPVEDGPLFREVSAISVLALPAEVAVVIDPDCDTGVPTQLINTALALGGGQRAVVVTGRYEHISFVVEPQQLSITVTEVTPPEPAKLLDQAQRLLAVSENLPPIRLRPEVVALTDLAEQHPATHYLLPCRGGAFAPAGAEVSYLDEHPDQADWLLLGCERSQQIHTEFYGERAARQVDICPRNRAGQRAERTLTKCCLQDAELVNEGAVASVPWGATLELVHEALTYLAEVAEES